MQQPQIVLTESQAVAVLIILLVFGILEIVANWKIFTKAGLKGWKSLIPFYNEYCAFRIAGMSGWWFLAPVVPVICFALAGINLSTTRVVITEAQLGNPFTIIGIVLMVGCFFIEVMQTVYTAKNFGKKTIFQIAAVLFPSITSLILGFGSAKYDKKALHD